MLRQAPSYITFLWQRGIVTWVRLKKNKVKKKKEREEMSLMDSFTQNKTIREKKGGDNEHQWLLRFVVSVFFNSTNQFHWQNYVSCVISTVSSVYCRHCANMLMTTKSNFDNKHSHACSEISKENHSNCTTAGHVELNML